METRAHHVLIGVFTLVVAAGVLLFALWLAKASINRQFHYYDIIFTEAVTGLSNGSAVQYNGIRVGEVSQLKLDPKDPRKVIARIRVGADTPVKIDTSAKLGLIGLTGVAFVQLSGGSPDSPLLLPKYPGQVPKIHAKSSALTKLLTSGSDVVTSLNGILDRLSKVVSSQNVKRINDTLENIDATTTTLAAERQDLRKLIRQAAAASVQLNQTLAGVNQLVNGPGQKTLESAQKAMASLQRTSATLNRLLIDNQNALQSGLHGMGQIGPTLRALRSTLHDLDQVTRKLQGNPAAFLLGRDQPAPFTPKP